MASFHCGETDAIISVNVNTTNGVYEVRVLRKWQVPDCSNPGTVRYVVMVLIDRYGHKIQATIPREVLSVFDDQIVEGSVYRISGLTVKPAIAALLPSYHRYVFVFNENSKVSPSDNSFIPTYGFSLIGAENVLVKKWRYAYMVDVIGVVTKVKHSKKIYSDGSVSRSVSFKLNDQRKSFWCELTGSLVDDFHTNVKLLREVDTDYIRKFKLLAV